MCNPTHGSLISLKPVNGVEAVKTTVSMRTSIVLHNLDRLCGDVVTRFHCFSHSVATLLASVGDNKWLASQTFGKIGLLEQRNPENKQDMKLRWLMEMVGDGF